MGSRFGLFLLTGLVALMGWAQELTFTHGVIFINEDRYGPNQGSVNFYNYDYDEMEYNVYAMVNPSTRLGVTTQQGQVYGGRLFLVSKQANGSESSGNTMGSRLAILDAATLKQQGSLLRFGNSPDSVYDGRSYCAVSNDKGYVATSAGIFVLDVNNLTTSGPIAGTQSSARGDYNSLYFDQCGDMVRLGQYVFAVQQGRGLHVVDPDADTVVTTLRFPHIVTVFVTARGDLYVANNSRTVYDFGAGPDEANFTRIDPVTFQTLDVFDLGDGHGALNSWGAWRSRMLCVDPVADRVYYYYEEFQNHISCYDFASREFIDHYIDLPEAADVNWDGSRNHQGLYAAALSFDPHTGDMVVQTTEAAPMYAYEIFNHNWVLFYDAATAELKRQERLRDAYWFPAMAVYPDLYPPTVSIDDQQMQVEQELVIDLIDVVHDPDNMAAQAVTTALSNDDGVARAWVEGLELHVLAVAAGETVIHLTTDSNGQIASTAFTVTVTAGGVLGDLTGDHVVDIADVVALIQLVLDSGPCVSEADINGDATLDVADVTLLIQMILNR